MSITTSTPAAPAQLKPGGLIISSLPGSAVSVIVACAMLGLWLLAGGHADHHDLHAILDTVSFALSAVVTLMLREVGVRTHRPFPLWLATSFGFTAALELLHVLIDVEWGGWLSFVNASEDLLRPLSWLPPSALLPLGLALSLLMLRRGHTRQWTLAAPLLLLTMLLGALARWAPRYTTPTVFGITRPSLIPIPLLCAAVAILAQRMLPKDRKIPMVLLLLLLLIPGHVVMLYSRSPHDTNAMIAHLGKICAYTVFLLMLMRMAARDMHGLEEARGTLAGLNAELEERVRKRTTSLTAEIAERQRAEDRVRAQLERLTLLDAITRAIAERQDPRSIFQVAIQALEDQFAVGFACILEFDASAGGVRLINTGIRSEEVARRMGLKMESLIVINPEGLRLIQRGELLYEADLRGVDRLPRLLAGQGMGSMVVAPILVDGRIHELLVLARPEPNAFSSGECEFVTQLNAHVSLAVKQAELLQALQDANEELRSTQQAVMQQERLNALGQMASGIAHDINNAISPISIFSSLLLEREDIPADALEDLTTINRAIDDVAYTVARMGAFYRRREAQDEMRPVDLNLIAKQVLDLTRVRWSDMVQERGGVIELDTDLAPNLPAVAGVEPELRELLVNLVFNAVDAMPEGGRLALRTQHNGGRVTVEVVDTGTGMDEETRQHCLEPFYTTKGERGTGLGLAMVYGIAKRHEALLEIDTAPGAGTTIRLVFRRDESRRTAEPAVSGPAVPRGLRVLLVDDDPLVLRAVRDLLDRDGQVVVTASGGQEGIDRYREAHTAGSPFQLVISDLGMPHVDGRRVARAVKELSPDTPIILLTGWGQRLTAEGGVPADVQIMLAKPPKVAELRAAIRTLFTGTST